MSKFVREISTYYEEDNKGKAIVCIDYSKEKTIPIIDYYDEKDKFIKTKSFPDKSLRYAEDAAENWALGYMD